MSVIFRRKLRHYEIRHELIDGRDLGCKDFIVKRAYTHKGDYIGSPNEAHFLYVKIGLVGLEKVQHGGLVGYNIAEKKWYGYASRLICGFGIGDRTLKGNRINTLREAKVSAKDFTRLLNNV